MRTAFRSVISTLVLMFLCVLGSEPTGIAESGAPVPADERMELVWDHSGLDVAGNPESLASFELQISDSTGATVLRTKSVPACGPGGAPSTCAQALIDTNLIEGTYSMRVRALDISGNPSDWSAPLLVAYGPSAPPPPGETVPPAAPTGLRVRLRVTVEIGG